MSLLSTSDNSRHCLIKGIENIFVIRGFSPKVPLPPTHVSQVQWLFRYGVESTEVFYCFFIVVTEAPSPGRTRFFLTATVHIHVNEGCQTSPMHTSSIYDPFKGSQTKFDWPLVWPLDSTKGTGRWGAHQRAEYRVRKESISPEGATPGSNLRTRISGEFINVFETT